MPSQKRKFGDIGEKAAENFLISSGYRILERNFRIKNIGEIDLVAKKGEKIFFCEVKTREKVSRTDFPIEYSIGWKKRRNLRKICELYLLRKELSKQQWQVDAIFITIDRYSSVPDIKHVENVLWEHYY